MHPVMFRVFGFPIHSYGVMLALAFLAAITVTTRGAKKWGENPDHVSNMALWVLVFSMIGARLFHVLVFWGHYSQNFLQAFNVREGGLVFYGGFIGGVIGAFIYFRRHHLSTALYADLAAPAVALGLAVARIGCTLAGCCHGRPCPADFPGAMVFPPETVGIPRVPLYPTQPAESFLSFLIFLFLYFVIARRKKFHGEVMAWFLILYGVIRSFLEFFRNDPRGFLGLFSFSAEPGLTSQTATGFLKGLIYTSAVVEKAPGLYTFQLSESQVVSLVLFAVAAALFIFLPKRMPVGNIPDVPKAPASAGKKGSGKKRKK